jgi:DNA-3-methyladenine glycosylase I
MGRLERYLYYYHDREWGVPVHDDRLLFEMLNLEGAQAGLSWLTILKKRLNYRHAFDNFEAKKITTYDNKKQLALQNDAGIVRNRLKINAVIENAKAFLRIQSEYGSFNDYIWHFSTTTASSLSHQMAIDISETMSKDMRRKGFRFVGPTICYAFMQAIGMINDHSPKCFRRTQV